MEPERSILSVLAPETLPARATRRAAWLVAEGVIGTSAGLLVARSLDIPQAGFFAIFLAAAALTARLEGLLDENRQAFLVANASSWDVNRRTGLSILSLFGGVLLAYAGYVVFTGEAALRGDFGFVLETARLGDESVFSRRFPSMLSLIAHNGAVLIAFFALGFVYRSYGALLALSWNACVWGIVLTSLIRRGLPVADSSPVVFVSAATAAVLPHLLLEATAYVLAAMAAIFLSKGVFKYPLAELVRIGVARGRTDPAQVTARCKRLEEVARGLLAAQLARRVKRQGDAASMPQIAREPTSRRACWRGDAPSHQQVAR